jgi:signal recognition particle receptor subunit beta
MTAKIVYYGPGLSGKTTSIQYIHAKINPKSKGKLVSLATETDRTLFFDFFPVEFGQIGGFKVKFNFYTVPGQVFYNTTRKLVLKGGDGVVFVADSQPGMMEQNLESLANLKENLALHGIDPATVPFVIQYNKRDMPGVHPVEEMRRLLNLRGVPDFETCATTGPGVMEAMKAICKLVLEDIQKKQKAGSTKAPVEKAPAALGGQSPVFRADAADGEIAPPTSTFEKQLSPSGPRAVERNITLSLRGPCSSTVVLGLPLDLQLEPGVEAVQVSADVRVTYRGGNGQVLVRDLTSGVREVGVGVAPAESASPAPSEAPKPAQKGFFARLFGR